ncbi:hypothetical protein DCAR_0104163 [Daucus carota subsp. sativus]|uniref:Calcyclin-binding protein n=1 Tax=Daucus carota subsp. sativus TaxID=79200 RepID=A0A166ILI6_DAUCS|nr:PREDICTED: calcyclin-binding protein-like [Daucus carota subsp. sativus]WOG84977.1 hypothetical protein DCAR_0104163 [Daucus carota subsp. sativus]
MADEIALDLEELRQLQSVAKRPRIVSLINSEISNLEKLSKDAITKETPKIPAPIAATKHVVTDPALKYVTLASFSWDQDDDKVKIYVFLEGVDQQKIESDFKPQSIDIKFHDVQGKNYRYALPKLNKKIEPEKCKLLVKPTRVVITLYKASRGTWTDLHYKEEKIKPGLDKEKDPMAGIMDLMKNMYEEGDEEMKRTIGKAWTDARSGKTMDPMKNFS